MTKAFLLTLALTLLVTLVMGHDDLHTQDQQLDVLHVLEGQFEDELRSAADQMLSRSVDSRALTCIEKSNKKRNCTERGGTCRASCKEQKTRRLCKGGCSCCSPCKNTKRCMKNGGTCQAKNMFCAGERADAYCKRGCTCCLPVATDIDCELKGGFCAPKTGIYCSGEVFHLQNSCNDLCSCCLPYVTCKYTTCLDNEICHDYNGTAQGICCPPGAIRVGDGCLGGSAGNLEAEISRREQALDVIDAEIHQLENEVAAVRNISKELESFTFNYARKHRNIRTTTDIYEIEYCPAEYGATSGTVYELITKAVGDIAESLMDNDITTAECLINILNGLNNYNIAFTEFEKQILLSIRDNATDELQFVIDMKLDIISEKEILYELIKAEIEILSQEVERLQAQAELCDPTCMNGGTCIAPNECSCTAEWTGTVCQTPVCDSTCMNNGTCISPNNCDCATNYTGTECQIPECRPSCKKGAQCTSPNNCEACGGMFNTNSGMIRHPLHDLHYTNYENCSWIIRTEHPITITFDRFFSEKWYDYLYIKDGDNVNSDEIAKYDGTMNESVHTTTNAAYLLWTSDSSNVDLGWEIHWEPLELKEVDFTTVGGMAKATSHWSDMFSALKGFAQPGSTWHSVSGSTLPQSIWYEFPEELRVMQYSFQSRTDGADNLIVDRGATRYEFWGSPNCSDSEEPRMTLVNDTSGTPFTPENIPKDSGLMRNPGSYLCYGFTIYATGDDLYVAMSNIRFYYPTE